MRLNNVIEIMAGSIFAIVLVSVLSEKSNWFNQKLTRYQGGSM
jgi:hypothetical protein|tara:strand:- start:1779 stop:1907 length:129 start_codon:yes stop_codon:yes gene_type:complete